MSFMKRWGKGWRLVVLIYIVLLICSHVWRLFNPVKYSPSAEQKIARVYAVNSDLSLQDQKIKIAYLDSYTGTKKDPPVLLLLHGSPVAVSMFQNFIPALTDSFRVIAPDFPGYAASTREVPDYSVRAYGLYMKQLMEELGVSKAHLVGYSLGGGVAINMAHYYPNKVQSIDMLSSIGVQELELMGSYHLNHAIHGIQLGLLWMLHESVPHFGVLDHIPINIYYARSFYDTDQRPLREYLKAYNKPMLIQHGKDDRLVPLVAAKEHHRIVPQSKMILYDGGGHGLVRSHGKRLAADLISFIHTVEIGEATVAATADSSRITDAAQPFGKIDFARFEGISLVIIMIIIALSTLISEDLTCIGAGLMAARGLIGFWPAVAACFIGILLGDMALYLAGRWLGRPAIYKAPFKWFVSSSDLDQSADWFKARGPTIIIASRFLPGSRFPTYFSAGVIGAGFWMFSFYFLIAALAWTPILVGVSMLLGTELMSYFALYKDYALWVFLAAILLLVIIAKLVVPSFSYRGRKLLKSRYYKLVNWEFWSPCILYFPVCCYIVYLWAKHRSLTLFTAANPAIPDGGFIDESKTQILNLFEHTGMVGKYQLIKEGAAKDEQLCRAKAFMAEHELSYPVFLKPDAGQRGAGVIKVHDEQQLAASINRSAYDLIIQEAIAGKEYGVFYYRYPKQEKGQIFSITTKQLPTLQGDGKSTLEELILDNKRALCLAKTHFKEHEGHLYEVPELGKIVELVKYGTHARGAIFGDGKELITEELTRTMDEICSKTKGFYFGRFDIKTNSEENLRQGKNLKIIEVNGVTSESTNIYDENYSYFKAQSILMKQWKIAFEIGKINAGDGVSFSSIPTLVKKLLNFKSKQ